ncbi:linear amide C-N hydrolase [Geminicoccus roseus]|uniref:linear amide C-N hydrolase n=1 Tax=Geminicoccus roseus TaxID=404900 RepID=UPI000410DAA4|nr:choloylglycine hydrolase family protein [Geminicoccus roseus]
MRPIPVRARKCWRQATRRVAALATVAALAVPQVAQACTSFTIPTADGGTVYGRTMEFGFDLKSEAIVIPRKLALAATGPDGQPGMRWTGKYGVVGLNGLDLPAVVDGINEKGLTGGILYFPDFAGYADPAKADPATALAPWDFLTWALTSFATVAEVKAALASVSVIGVKPEGVGFVPPFHYTLHDPSGASLVVEPVDGELKVYDNPLGVMTNAPGFDWHLTNLRNYIKLSADNAPPLELAGTSFAQLGQGSGLLGVPGDPTPPSRLIRALGYTMSVEKQPGGLESVRLAEHILNNFDIPKGWVREKDQADAPLEYTQWSSIADLANRRYYVKTYEDQVLRSIDLTDVDLDADRIVTAPLPSGADPAILPLP